MLQVATVCLWHRRQLEERCLHCQRKQSVIPARIQLGCCTQCMTWLGIASDSEAENEVDEETLDWQQWAVNIIGELRKASIASGIFPWERLANGLALCSEIVGSSKQLAALAGISKQLLSSWQNRKQLPSFERMLELCYVLDISPLLLMTNNLPALKEVLQARETHRQPRTKHFPPHPVNREQALTLIQSVLDGRRPLWNLSENLERVIESRQKERNPNTAAKEQLAWPEPNRGKSVMTCGSACVP